MSPGGRHRDALLANTVGGAKGPVREHGSPALSGRTARAVSESGGGVHTLEMTVTEVVGLTVCRPEQCI